jgi:putative peptide zinc metalloprotease protein
LIGLGLAVLVLGLIIPWRITITGPFVAAPALSIPLTAPDSGFIERVQVLEGTRVTAGAPLLQIRNLELERELATHQRISDSLAVRSAQARGRSQTSQLALLEAAGLAEQARVAGLRDRVAALRIRALGSGTVVTPRPEQLAGQWVSSGERLLELGQPDTIEIRIALSGAGATSLLPNSHVRLLADATLRSPVKARITTISAQATSPGAVEARLRLAAPGLWRPGMTGQASVTLRRSNAWGALWWTIRSHVRSDILL